MKRSLEEDSLEVPVGKKGRLWVHDRQPDWEDLRRMEEGEEDDDDVILRSRRRQHRLDTQGDPECSDMEAPGAPVKSGREGRRPLPWNEQGRLLWPKGEDEAVVLVEDSQAGESGEGEGDSRTLEGSVSGCSSFVVDDDSESVLEEEKGSERRLGRTALEEVRRTLKESMERQRVRLERVERELLEAESPGSVTSQESDGEVMDERTCTSRRDVQRLCVYPWEDEKWLNGAL